MWAIQHFRVYLEGQEFLLLTDHNALCYKLKQTNPRGRIARWVTFLNQFIYTVKHVPGRKNVVTDALSRRDYEVIRTDADEAIEAFPDLDAIKAVSKANHSGSSVQIKVKLDPSLQVMSYQPSKPVKDFMHTEATFGSSTTPSWGK